jgi:hypothetical protein
VRVSGNLEGTALAGRALVDAARPVDAAMRQARPSPQLQSAWSALRAQLAELDPTFR